MDFRIDTSDLDRVRRQYAVFSDRRFNAGMATALSKTAGAVRQAQQAEMRDVFDRPTRWALGSVFVDPASAEKLTARVGIMDNPFGGRPPIRYLRWQIYGGTRTPKAFEKRLMLAGAMPDDMRVVPGRGAKLDAFGNISYGQAGQILSQLRIEVASGSTTVLPRLGKNERALLKRSGGRVAGVGPVAKSYLRDALQKRSRIVSAYKRAGGQYVAFPYGRGKLRPGVYLFDRFNGRDPLPVLIFVPRAAYEAGRYDFHYVSELAIKRHLADNVSRAMADQLSRWASKYGAAR